MVKRRADFPSKGELVIGTVREINPNSVFVELEEYDKEGMIHISEIAKKWVRDIRDWVSVDEKIVCRVKNIRKKKDQIDLSLKEVSDRDKNRRMQTWKRDERGEDFLEELAEANDISLKEAYEKIGYELQKNFKDMLEAFEIAVRKGVEELVKRGVEEDWTGKIKKIGEKNIKRKKKELTERFNLSVSEPTGVEIIKDALNKVAESRGVEFKYISAPEYEIKKEGRDLKEAEKSIEASTEELEEELQGKDFELQKL
ncbi:MAG: S1 RNA-binding domain-containing protein [Candidatus Aenigmatarchaeota archaeon]